MISIIDYEAGNLKSVECALTKLGFECSITQNNEEIIRSERIIFPGVGAAGKAMADMRRLGLDNALMHVFEAGKPVLGICLGAQIILDRSQENLTECLGLIPGEVKLFPQPLFSSDKKRLKIPHMGWNGIEIIKGHPVLNGVGPDDEFYFVHSYYLKPASDKYIIGVTEHGIEFCSVLGYRNLIAMQFHPEKSGSPGLRILRNFCKWDGIFSA